MNDNYYRDTSAPTETAFITFVLNIKLDILRCERKIINNK